MADRPRDLLAALADESRLRVFAAVILGGSTLADIRRVVDVDERAVLRSLSRLESAGLVHRKGDGWVARPEELRAAAVATAEPTEYVDHGSTDARTVNVLRRFMPAGRLTQLPSSRAKRLVVLDHIARVFEPGVRYPEREVNAALGAFHDDYAALRRYLVDEEFLAREGGTYWRIGGGVDL